MTAFTIGEVSFALAVGLAMGVVAMRGFKTKAALEILKQRMGALFSVSVFASAALPTAAMLLVGSLRSVPSVFDSMLVVVLIGLGLIAGFTLLGNALTVIEGPKR
jgi:hypothetical protein